jgi:hypothetical protein
MSKTAEEFPFVTKYDPSGSSEGTLDPLGLYLLADQLATKLVPAVRERMLRIRFLTAMTVGSLVTEGVECNPLHPETPPYLVWEWLVVEAITRSFGNDSGLWGVPGSDVTRKAISQHGYVDHRTYLKTPRVFGFNGVYKRLATHLGLVDTHLLFSEPEGEELVFNWSGDLGIGRFGPSHVLCGKWRKAVEASLGASPPRTKTNLKPDDWKELASVFLPQGAGSLEKSWLKRILLSEIDLEALPEIWKLVAEYGESPEEIDEKDLHKRLSLAAPRYDGLIRAIHAYEGFCRFVSDAFNILRVEATVRDAKGLIPSSLARDAEFSRLSRKVNGAFHKSVTVLNDLGLDFRFRFEERFKRFSEPMTAGDFAVALCAHHEYIQKEKSPEGKRSWFDPMGEGRIYLRRNYTLGERSSLTDAYVHDYRAKPIHTLRCGTSFNTSIDRMEPIDGMGNWAIDWVWQQDETRRYLRKSHPPPRNLHHDCAEAVPFGAVTQRTLHVSERSVYRYLEAIGDSRK